MASNLRFKYDEHVVSPKKFRLMVTDKVILATVDRIVEIAEEELADARCPVHGKLPEIIISLTSSGDLNVHTKACCESFTRSTTTSFQTSFNKTAYFTPGMRLLLLPEGADYPFAFNAGEFVTLSLGRSDPESSARPDIDLCEFGALKRGVSRKHASITWHQGALHITDEDSANGTYVNGERLEPNEPCILHDDDCVKLGGLAIKVMLIGCDN